MIIKTLSILLLFCILLSGCSNSPILSSEPPVTTDPPVSSFTPSASENKEASLSELSHLELLVLTAESDAIEEWYYGPPLTSSHYFTEMDWIFCFIKECPPFQELINRSAAILSLHSYAPGMIEDYLKSNAGEKQIRGIYLAALTKQLCPEYVSRIDEILDKYQ